MDAVKKFIEEQGGHVTINLSGTDKGAEAVPFELYYPSECRVFEKCLVDHRNGMGPRNGPREWTEKRSLTHFYF